MHDLDIPITLAPTHRHIPRSKASESDETEVAESQSYLRVPVWVIILLATIAGGLVINGAATVYWAATLKQSFEDFKKETYVQKINTLETTITDLKTQITNEAIQRKTDVDNLTERENDTRLRLAQHRLLNGK